MPTPSLFMEIGKTREKCKLILSTLAVGAFMFFLNSYLKKMFKKRLLQFQIDNDHDILKINKLLVFGGYRAPCDGHIKTNLQCQNLNCNFGKLRYLLEFIDNCKETLDVCMYIISAGDVRDCIINAFKRGVRVRVITDADASVSHGSCIPSLRKLNIPVRQQKSNFIMHHKFVIVDSQILITGSMNFTMSGALHNWESVLITTQPLHIKSFNTAFESLWLDFAPNKIYSRFMKNSEKKIQTLRF